MNSSTHHGGSYDDSQSESPNTRLSNQLTNISDASVLRHFFGFPIFRAPQDLHEAAIVCLNASWWQKSPCPTTELGIAELMMKGLSPIIHAENILSGMRVAHARIIPNAHLQNNYKDAGDPENFSFGHTKFVTMEEAKEILVATFFRTRSAADNSTAFQPIILIGHAVSNFFEHVKDSLDIDLQSYDTIIKVIDTQNLAKDMNIYGPKGPNISLQDLLAHFKLRLPNLHTAGNDAAGALIAAVLTSLRDDIYMHGIPQAVVVDRDIQDVVERVQALGKSLPPPSWGREKFCTKCDRENHGRHECRAKVLCLKCENSGVVKLYRSRKTHKTSRCAYQYQNFPTKDYNV